MNIDNLSKRIENKYESLLLLVNDMTKEELNNNIKLYCINKDSKLKESILLFLLKNVVLSNSYKKLHNNGDIIWNIYEEFSASFESFIKVFLKNSNSDPIPYFHAIFNKKKKVFLFNNSLAISMTNSMKKKRKLLEKLQRDYYTEYNIYPTISQLSDISGISELEIDDCLNFQFTVQSLNYCLDEEQEIELLDLIPDNNDYHELVEKLYDCCQDELDKDILRGKQFGISDDKIAIINNVSRQTIARRKKSIREMALCW